MQALSRCSLKHCVALWQLLSSFKSETMLRLKRVRHSTQYSALCFEFVCENDFLHLLFQDPFVGISEEYKRPLKEEHKRLLTSFFTKSSADAFLLEMHEFLLLVLKNPKATDTFKPDWGWDLMGILAVLQLFFEISLFFWFYSEFLKEVQSCLVHNLHIITEVQVYRAICISNLFISIWEIWPNLSIFLKKRMKDNLLMWLL